MGFNKQSVLLFILILANCSLGNSTLAQNFSYPLHSFSDEETLEQLCGGVHGISRHFVGGQERRCIFATNKCSVYVAYDYQKSLRRRVDKRSVPLIPHDRWQDCSPISRNQYLFLGAKKTDCTHWPCAQKLNYKIEKPEPF